VPYVRNLIAELSLVGDEKAGRASARELAFVAAEP
jgi:hypothetical protein